MNNIDHAVLLIEDEIMYRLKIKRYLSRFRQVHEADDLEQAFEILVRHEDIDLIMLDLGLPKSNGADTVDQLIAFIKERSRITDIPIIVLTANTDPDVLQAALVSGAQEHLEKQRINDGYVVEKTAYFAIRNQAREKVLAGNSRIHRLVNDMEWQQMTRKAALMHELPAGWAFNELKDIHTAIAKVPRRSQEKAG